MQAPVQHEALPPISVLVCAHDEEANLRELIPQLLKQTHSTFEVIVVDDRSNDGTFDYLLEETKRDSRLRVIKVSHVPDHIHGKKFALTLAIKAASFDWVLLTDADCRPASAKWITAMASACHEPHRFVLGYSPYEEKPGILNFLIRYETLFTAMQYLGFAQAGMPYMGVGRNLAYHKSVFLQNKGFHKHLSVTGGDDDLFVNAHATSANTAVVVGAEALVYSKPKTTWRNFFRQKVRHLAVGKKYRMSHRAVLGIVMGSLLFAWFGAISLVILRIHLWAVLSVIAVRASVVVFSAHTIASRLGTRFPWAVAPLLDFLLAFYYISTAPVALLTKRVKWKT
jgi:glycosyltransferase involved in cell wall biosynthesis